MLLGCCFLPSPATAYIEGMLSFLLLQNTHRVGSCKWACWAQKVLVGKAWHQGGKGKTNVWGVGLAFIIAYNNKRRQPLLSGTHTGHFLGTLRGCSQILLLPPASNTTRSELHCTESTRHMQSHSIPNNNNTNKANKKQPKTAMAFIIRSYCHSRQHVAAAMPTMFGREGHHSWKTPTSLFPGIEGRRVWHEGRKQREGKR